MNNCLLCHSSFRREINYEKLFLFVKYKERYTCSECLKKFVKKKGKICSGCNKEIDTKGLCNDCLQWKRKYAGNLLDNRSLYQYHQLYQWMFLTMDNSLQLHVQKIWRLYFVSCPS